MPRSRRRSASRFHFDDFDLLISPEREGRFNSEAEWERCVSAMRAWYALHGAEWEAEQALELPGRRSWAWWTFVAGEAMPPHDDELRRLQELRVLTVEEQLQLEINRKEAA